MDMQITVNGEPRQVRAGHTVAALVRELALTDQRIAIEVNEEIVPHSEYPDHALQPGDRVEVVTAIGGG